MVVEGIIENVGVEYVDKYGAPFPEERWPKEVMDIIWREVPFQVSYGDCSL